MNGNSGHRQFGSGTGSSQHEETQEAALSSSTSQAVGGEVSRGASTLSPSSPLTLSLLLDEAASAADVEDDVVFQMWLDQEAVLERALPLHDILAREEAVERALVASMAAMGRTDLDSFLAMIQQPLLLLHQSSYWRGAGIAQGSQGSRGWARLWGFDAAVRVAGGTGGAGAGERSRPLSEAEISRNTRRWTFRNRETKATKQKDSAVAKCAKGACSCGQEEGAPPARRASVGYSGSNLPRSSTCSTLCKEAKKRSTYQSSIVAQPPLPPGAAGVREQFSGGCGSTSMRHITAGSPALSAGGGRRAGEGSCVNSTGNGADRGKDEEQTDSEDSSRCCSICLAEYQTGDDMMTLRCMHMFHHHCVHDWLTHSGRRVCPLCLVTIIESEGKGEEEFKIREPSAGDIAERGAARAACGDTTENGGTGEEYREEQAEVGYET
ncbi:zinc finger, C3HC4 type (RING finger) domain-containing protein [Besnoitia besnoiti]|uniref:RING-type E3 ubiquitin transferase n=1 Tax=Besnoitia besnoiti TaxID=94643 RepID=A0A2A9MPX5_BESBE|nr:zinc finger, C3HC4 type (RING finger) domain-containing protein [Besnoitia besnoiti]PFH38456.1 zinc finger, C3HC4 type (RING finger) domain-containing protein [Besnoitia besnoiti]